MLLPRGGSDEDEFSEEVGAADGGEDADHGGEGVAHVGAAVDGKRVEDVEEVVDVGVEAGVAVEVEVVRVDAAGADEVVEDDAVVRGEEGEDALPRRLVGAEAVGQHQEPLAGADHPHVERLQEYVAHDDGENERNRKMGSLKFPLLYFPSFALFLNGEKSK